MLDSGWQFERDRTSSLVMWRVYGILPGVSVSSRIFFVFVAKLKLVANIVHTATISWCYLLVAISKRYLLVSSLQDVKETSCGLSF